MTTEVTVVRQGSKCEQTQRKPLGMYEVPKDLARGHEFSLGEFPGVSLTVITVAKNEVIAYASADDYDNRLNVDESQAAA